MPTATNRLHHLANQRISAIESEIGDLERKRYGLRYCFDQLEEQMRRLDVQWRELQAEKCDLHAELSAVDGRLMAEVPGG